MAQSRADRRRIQRRLGKERRAREAASKQRAEARAKGGRPKGERPERHAGDLSKQAKQTRLNYLIDHPEAKRNISPQEKKELARTANESRMGRADPRYEKEFKEFWYHTN